MKERGHLMGGVATYQRGRRTLFFIIPGLLAALLLASVVALAFATSSRAATTFNVNSNADAVDIRPGNGICAASGNRCTLRAAIQESNVLPGADVVNVPAGTYELKIAPLNTNNIATGDLDITDELTINGANRTTTILDGGVPKAGSPPNVTGLDRLFEVHPTAGEVRINKVMIREGYVADYGGAIFNGGNATVTVFQSNLQKNSAGKTGGAIDNHVGGTVRVEGSLLTGSVANEGSAINNDGAGTIELTGTTVTGSPGSATGSSAAILNNAVLNAQGAINVTNSTISRNTGGAIGNDGAGTVTVAGTKFLNNTTTSDGGAISNESGGAITVTGSTFSGNEAVNGGAINNGDLVNGGGTMVVRSSTFGPSTVGTTTYPGNLASADGGAINNIGTATLDVLENSTFTENGAQGEGGAVHNADKGSMKISSATFSDNGGLNGGGFANNGDGLVTVENSDFLRNRASLVGDGGGLHTNSDGVFELTGGTFDGNTALNGAGFSNDGDGTVTITGAKFSKNTAEGEGGGVAINSGEVQVIDSQVLDNSATIGGGGIAYQGDAAVSIGRSAAIRDTTISGNTTPGVGGGVNSLGDGILSVNTSTIISNTAGTAGGGIHHLGDAELNVNRSTLSNNQSDSGAGMFSDGDGAALLQNTTVSGNSATGFGGGVLVSSRVTLNNATVAANSAPEGGGINNGGGDLANDGVVFLRNTIVADNPNGGNCAGVVTSYGGNVEGTDTCLLREQGDQPSTNPLLDPLAANGGPTRTHALRAGSPAQDAAVCARPTPDVPACLNIDQRGVARPKYAGHDVGAFESELEPGPPPNPTCAGRSERVVLASEDAWVSQGSPNTNFGTDPILKVKSQNTSNSRALVRFDLPSVPPGCQLVAAKLRLHSPSATAGRTLQALRIGASWSETSVAWAGQPATAGAAVSTASGLGYRQWNVLGQTKLMYSGQNNGYLIRDGAENGTGIEQAFHSREKGTTDSPPELVLTFDDPGGTATCPTTPQTLTANADSWVNQGDPLKNFGLDPVLKVRSKAAINTRALVKFPLTAMPAGCTSVKSAALKMHSGSGAVGQRLQAFRLGATWNETGVTWDNQPAKTGAVAVANSTPEGLFEWSVASQVQGMYPTANPTANYGFLIRHPVEDGTGAEQGLHSRENAIEKPQLVITYQ